MNFHFFKKHLFLSLFVIFFASLNLAAQTPPLSDRFFVQVGAGLNMTNGTDDPVALAIHVEPRLFLRRRTSLGLRYDVGLFSFGDQRVRQSGDVYVVTDSDLSLLRSGALLGYFHFKMVEADFQIGLGTEYVGTVPRVIRYYTKSTNEFLGMETTEGQNKLGLAMAFSVGLGPSFFTLKLASFNRGSNSTTTDSYVNISIGQCIVDDRTGWWNTPSAEQIPTVFLEFGAQSMLPTFGEGEAAAFGAYLEPKFAVSKRSSIGFRYDFEHAKNKGFDTDLEFATSQSGFGRRDLRSLNRLAHTSSMLVTYDYYYPTTGGWYFVGAGVGNYTQSKMHDLNFTFFSNSTVNFPAVSSEENLGVMLRVGMKTSLVRIALSYNYSGKNISDYIGFQMGFEPSFLRE